MIKDLLIIDAEAFNQLGIDVKEVLEYIENKKAIALKPIHVNSYQYLKEQTVASS